MIPGLPVSSIALTGMDLLRIIGMVGVPSETSTVMGNLMESPTTRAANNCTAIGVEVSEEQR